MLNIMFRHKKNSSVHVRYDIDTLPQLYRVAVMNGCSALLRVAEEEQSTNALCKEANLF